MISRRATARNFVENLGKQPTGKLVQALAAELIATRRVNQVDLVLSDIAAELFELRGELHGTVTSAHKLSGSLHDELVKHVKQLSGAKSVSLSTKVDESLIGGVIIETPTEQYDLSVRHKLDSLEGVQ